uniref:YadA C-terminal domain-containing protein n=1 Tax=Providencia sp. PROV255 TaxID=2949943 RepID=UPI00234A6440
DHAQSSADKAHAAANDAQSSADNAQGTANTAVSKADKAQVTANQAVSKADLAQNTANEANVKVEEVRGVANDARKTAGTALTTAQGADKKADKAFVRAEEAEKNAVTKSNTYTDTRYHQSITYAQNAANTVEVNANYYTDTKFKELRDSSNQRFKQLGEKIERAENRLNAGIAGVTAISSIPYASDSTFSYGIGLGNYQNGNAIAGGVQFKTSPNTRVRFNVSLDSENNNAIGVGIASGW